MAKLLHYPEGSNFLVLEETISEFNIENAGKVVQLNDNGIINLDLLPPIDALDLLVDGGEYYY